MGTTLIILISVAWLAVAVLVLAMCRLAAHADKSLDEELAERIAASRRAEDDVVTAERPARQLSAVQPPGKYRATGS
jgi:hypothetical protein